MNDPFRQIIYENLSYYGGLRDEELRAARVALDLAALNHPGISLARYETHLEKIVSEVGARYKELVKAGAGDTVGTKLAALKHVFSDKYGYSGMAESHGGLFDADLIEVIDKRCGLPVLLAVLYVHAAQEQGWSANGLNVPGRFVVRLEQEGTRLIFDPASECRVLQAADLRRFVKQALGPQAELSADFYEPVSNRAMLVRLQNTIKIRHIENEEYDEALETVEALRRLAPDEYRLLLDAGLLYARSNRRDEAIEALEQYISQAPDPRDRHDAALLIQQIRNSQL